VQDDSIKPMLKPSGTKHLQLEYDILLSTFAFKFNLRRYTLVPRGTHPMDHSVAEEAAAVLQFVAEQLAGWGRAG